jgi:thiol-disulfide isomerase/thioredoxin
MSRPFRAAVAALSVVGLCAGCAGVQGGAEGFVSGAGTVTVVEPADRVAAPPIAGETLDGDALALADFAGQLVVLNVWGSWCGPCRSEAPELIEAAAELEAGGVQFLGVNVRDHGQREAAQAFVRRFGVPYPSLYDPDGSSLLGLRPRASAIPSPVLIDPDGMVAATVLGEVTSSTLVELVRDVQGDDQREGA